MTKEKVGEIVRYGIVGVFATILQFILYYILVFIMSHIIALPISYAISLFFNFLLSSFFTFKVKPSAKKGIGFLMSHGLNFALQFVFLNFFIWIGIEKQWALIPVFAICIPVNFILVRLSMKRL